MIESLRLSRDSIYFFGGMPIKKENQFAVESSDNRGCDIYESYIKRSA